jgi:hypothetical protein
MAVQDGFSALQEDSRATGKLPGGPGVSAGLRERFRAFQKEIASRAILGGTGISAA